MMDDLNKAFNYLFGFKVPIDDYDEFEKKVEEARELKEYLDKVEILKDIPQIVTPVKMTNYDRIKSMSVLEIANFLSEIQWKAMQGKSKYSHEWERWLLQEVSENG